MAIKIPSRNIYEKDNDKIRDNKIDRIEVGAFEVVPNNEYETPVYNSQIDMSKTLKEERNTQQSGDYLDVNGYNIDIGGIATKAVDRYATISEIKIAKNKGNKTITKIYNEKKENSGTSYTQISKYIEEKTFYYESNNAYTYNNDETSNYGSFNFDVISSIQQEEKELQSSNSIQDIFSNSKVKFTADFNGGNNNFFNRWSFTKGTPELNYNIHAVLDYGENISVYKDFPKDEGSDLSSLTIESDDEYYYIKNLKILIGRTIYCCATALRLNIPLSSYIGSRFPCKIVEIQRNVEKAEITVYGNTIGIDLQDKTIYVPNKEGSKPFSVEGNELMQTSNHFVSAGQQLVRFSDYNITHLDDRGNDINNDGKDYNDWDYGFGATVIIKNPDFYGNELAIRIFGEQDATTFHDVKFTPTERKNYINVDNDGYYMGKVEVYENRISSIKSSFNKTLNQYAKGKETATIRCSISDYYDEKGEKVIATNNSNKMAFDIYDEVIPYSYGADGNDKPLSRHKDGSPKTFVVLGTRIFYDGAVWQELTLQEK